MNRYVYSLSLVFQLGKQYAVQRLSRLHLGVPEMIVLMYLSRFHRTNQETMAKYYMMDKGTVAKSIRKLEQKGLVERHRNAENKRENIVSLTAQGETLMEEARVLFREWGKDLFRGISDQDLMEFDRILNRMIQNLNQIQSETRLEEKSSPHPE